MTDPASLAQLGLNAYEAAAYLALLGRPELTPSEVAGLGKIPRQRVYDVLESLAAKGLCRERENAPKSYAAVDPRAALEMLGQERLAELDRERVRTRTAVDRLAEELGPIFAAGKRQNDPLAYVEVLSGSARIAHRAMALAASAKRSVTSCVKRPMILSPDQNWSFMTTPLGRGLSYRALYEEGALGDPEFSGWMSRLADRGLSIRLSPEVPLKIQSFDDEVVLVSMQDPMAGEPSFTAVVIHNRGLAAMLGLAFEHLWERARPFPEKAGSEPKGLPTDQGGAL
ncbi:TrmB family transcriptional regulator [Desulfolutivibrio sulfoxidireducens]|uniref:TrmB family transcriptional regulator n=1 Tax=Desulfolutivibrio sulfoxidireducens TaxID=2773299 RepID=UPI00159EB2A5|nr:helix-turn-helix domain-containing protein [Desulfolutivibrio sulfoxidireducens]QLA15502.1 TrmB family transcriptional regulator [Desulfolutivibrio sulfoxidireducens]